MTPADAPVFLIGYRGTGKTTAARTLAALMDCQWVDADDVIEERAGKTIAAIFADDGETVFRDWEERVVRELSGRRRIVIGLGGGAVLREANRRAITGAGGQVVWLTASVDTILERLAADASTGSRRPNLTKVGGLAEVETLLSQRMPLYRECATLVVDTDGKSAAEVAEEIAARLS